MSVEKKHKNGLHREWSKAETAVARERRGGEKVGVGRAATPERLATRVGGDGVTATGKGTASLCPTVPPTRAQGPGGWPATVSSCPGPWPCVTWCPGWSPGPASPGCAPAGPCCPWCPRGASRHLSAPRRPRGAGQRTSGLRGSGG